MRKYIVQEQTTLKQFTDVTDAQASFVLRTLLKRREVRVNGVKVGADLPLARGDEVCYFMTPAQESRPAFEKRYEDGNVVVIDKESGVSSEAVFAALGREGETYFLHRLDRNTAGIMIFAKTPAAAREIGDCFREHRVEKVYLARVFGVPSPAAATREARLEKDEARSLVRVGSKGEKIVTSYETLSTDGEISLLRVLLHTGKTHQIRAHLAYLGYPVVGDEKYGDHGRNRAVHASRQQLIAVGLTLFPSGDLTYLAGKTFLSQKKFHENA